MDDVSGKICISIKETRVKLGWMTWRAKCARPKQRELPAAEPPPRRVPVHPRGGAVQVDPRLTPGCLQVTPGGPQVDHRLSPG
jgi:hypothetical protein